MTGNKKPPGLFENIREIVRQIPRGKVATYGQVARMAGTKDARKVGWALWGNQDPKIPCHRVVKAGGFLARNYSLGGWKGQAKMLEKEGGRFVKEDQVDLKKCGWQGLWKKSGFGGKTIARMLVTPKINPDLDGLACAYAYARLLRKQGKNTTEGIWGRPHMEAEYLIERFEIEDVNYAPKGKFDQFVLVDASGLRGMPEVVEAERIGEVIDHREATGVQKLFPRAKIQIEKVGAAATLITERYQKSGIKIDENSTILLYGAIYSNSLSLKARATSDRDRKAAVWLKSQTKIPDDLVREMFAAKTQRIRDNLPEALRRDFKEFKFGGESVGIGQLEVVRLEKLVKEKRGEILKVLKELEGKFQLVWVFLTAVDLEKKLHLLVTDDPSGQAVLKKVFGVKFENNVAKRKGLILRKELVPLLASELASPKASGGRQQSTAKKTRAPIA